MLEIFFKKLFFHYKKLFKGEKPYRCPHPKCTYAACRKDMITRHLKVHNKNRSPSSNNLFVNSSTNMTAEAAIASRNTSSSSPSSLSLSVSSPPHFSISLTSPLMNLEINSDHESSSVSNDHNNNENFRNSDKESGS